jgi:hypothetical protein
MGSKGSAPAPPDYVGAAQLQGELSKETLNMQNYANRPVQNTPFGTVSWGTQAVEDPATGDEVTQWTQNTTLAPGLQNALDSQIALQQNRSGLAEGFMDRVAGEYSQPFNWGGLPQMAQANQPGELTTRTADYVPGLQTSVDQQAVQQYFNTGDNPALPSFDSGYRDQVARTLMERMVPVHERQQRQIETKLANQGFRTGTEGYKTALAEMQERQAAERYNALDTAGQEAQRLYNMQMGGRQQAFNEDVAGGQFFNTAGQQAFNQGLAANQFNNQALGQASALDLARMGAQNTATAQQYGLNQQFSDAQNKLRQQAIAEEAQRRGMSLNEMNALLTGQQVSMPQMPTFNRAGLAETPNILGATSMGYDAALGAYNANQAGANNMISGLFGLGSAAASNPFMFSDQRLKSNVRRIGTHAIGVGIYEYTMFGVPQTGVIAQEVERVRPDLVRRHANGYLTVNYGGL